MRFSPKYYSLLLVFVVLNIYPAFSQDNCASSLKKAEKLFDEGKLEEVPATLSPCIANGFTKAQKIRAYELIIQSYLAEDLLVEADAYMLKLLALEPNYQVNTNVVSSRFKHLFETIQTQAVFSAGVIVGLNTSQIAIIEEYGLHNLNNVSGNYSSNTGFTIGLSLKKSIVDDLEIDLECKYSRNSFEYSLPNAYDFSEISYIEHQNYLDIPLSFTYQYRIKDFAPYARLGFNTGILLNAEMQANRNYNDNSHSDISGTLRDISNKREDLNFMLVFGIGLRYVIDKGYFFIDMRYNKGLTNRTIDSERYIDEDLIYKYYIIDDDFYLNSFSFAIGYSYSFHKPQKKRKAN